MYKMTAPAEINDQVRQISEVQAQTAIKKPDSLEKSKPDLENDSDQQKDLQGRDSDEEKQDQTEENNNYTDRNKYKVKFNPITDMVELIDQQTGLVAETISSNDLVNLVSRSMSSSGVFVDEKI
jgi:uncharacterized FlaG/YvyC family protein